MTRFWTAAVLLADFLWHVITAGVTTAWQIVRHRSGLSPALVHLEYDGLSPTGAVVYASLLSLTPGTSAIDIDVERRTLLLHVLDGRHANQVLDDARRRVEARLKVLFPEVLK